MNDAMQKRAKELVVNYFNNRVDKTDKKKITEDDVFIVWFCKTLQNLTPTRSGKMSAFRINPHSNIN